jgi:hypothetical protein
MTSRRTVVGFEHVEELVKAKTGFIMVVWHGRTLIPLYHLRKLHMWAITAWSRDGALQTRIIGRLGYRCIRGSTGLGGVRAAVAGCAKLKAGEILALTPDGPLGPPYEVQEGILLMAERTGCPIVPLGVGIKGRKLLGAWDSYAIPSFFNRCAMVIGEPIYIQRSESEPDRRRHAELVKTALDEAFSDARKLVGEP